MSVIKKYRIIFLSCIIFIAGCRKNNTADNFVAVEGKIRLQVTAMHHSWAVSGLNVYIKKDATEWPGPDTTIYNAMATTDSGGNVVFEHLFPASYFIYAKGYDPIFRANVTGGAVLTLDASTVTNNEAYITLQVSE